LKFIENNVLYFIQSEIITLNTLDSEIFWTLENKIETILKSICIWYEFFGLWDILDSDNEIKAMLESICIWYGLFGLLKWKRCHMIWIDLIMIFMIKMLRVLGLYFIRCEISQDINMYNPVCWYPAIYMITMTF
jgi:hypothetical protein